MNENYKNQYEYGENYLNYKNYKTIMEPILVK